MDKGCVLQLAAGKVIELWGVRGRGKYAGGKLGWWGYGWWACSGAAQGRVEYADSAAPPIVALQLRRGLTPNGAVAKSACYPVDQLVLRSARHLARKPHAAHLLDSYPPRLQRRQRAATWVHRILEHLYRSCPPPCEPQHSIVARVLQVDHADALWTRCYSLGSDP